MVNDPNRILFLGGPMSTIKEPLHYGKNQMSSLLGPSWSSEPSILSVPAMVPGKGFHHRYVFWWSISHHSVTLAHGRIPCWYSLPMLEAHLAGSSVETGVHGELFELLELRITGVTSLKIWYKIFATFIPKVIFHWAEGLWELLKTQIIL